ncbi:tyrosinase [Malassezia brasiliensis]|uniref:Tyrosinase n=1 Tax=Malassezia brasiliensis TaxID=1821822 RepID=A0AAF0IP29_9BASI|nr:tyrosinase [Malassezia brasiliensis]
MAMERGPDAAHAPGECARLERMRTALDKFLTLIDDKANAKNFAVALPNVDEVALEKTRLQFVQDLKSAIRNDLNELVEKHDLGSRLSELQELVDEADERERNAYAPQSAELKDVWRPDLDISTAIRARIAADQQARMPALEHEFAELQAANAESAERIAAIEQEADDVQANVADALAMLDKLRGAVSLPSEDAKALHAMLDALLTDMGPV